MVSVISIHLLSNSEEMWKFFAMKKLQYYDNTIIQDTVQYVERKKKHKRNNNALTPALWKKYASTNTLPILSEWQPIYESIRFPHFTIVS